MFGDRICPLYVGHMPKTLFQDLISSFPSVKVLSALEENRSRPFESYKNRKRDTVPIFANGESSAWEQKNPILFSMKICSDCHLLLVWNPAMWIEIISGYRISLGCWKSELSAELFPRNIIGDMVTGNERFAKLINFNFSCPQKMILYNVEASVVRIMRRQQTRMRGEKMKRQNHFSERILEILF